MKYRLFLLFLLFIVACSEGGGIKTSPFESNSTNRALAKVAVIKETIDKKEVESVKIELINSFCKDSRRKYVLKIYTRNPLWNDLDCSYKSAWKIEEYLVDIRLKPTEIKRIYLKGLPLQDGEKVYEITFDDNCTTIDKKPTLLFHFLGTTASLTP